MMISPSTPNPSDAGGWRHSQRGYSLIELMVALLIGLILLLGVVAVFANSRSVYQTSETQAHMLDDARFVLQLLGEDLRMAGSWGPNSHTNLVANRTGQPGALGNITGDCEPGWYTDLDRRVIGTNDTNPYSATCIPGGSAYLNGTDVLAVRYANPNPVANANLAANVVYVQSDPTQGRLFVGGGAVPTINPNQNFPIQAVGYYVSDFTETPGDGLPSLHRVSLGVGPSLTDDLIAQGVDNLQIQYGIDTCNPQCDGQVNSYVNSDSAAIDWTDPVSVERIRAVRVWVLLRSEFPDATVPTTTQYNLGGQVITPGDNFRRLLVSNVYQIRNRPPQ